MRNKKSSIQRDGFEITEFDDGSKDFKNLNQPLLIEGDKKFERLRSYNIDKHPNNLFTFVTNVYVVENGKWCFSHTVG